jgi:hypothetical protein
MSRADEQLHRGAGVLEPKTQFDGANGIERGVSFGLRKP